MNYDVFLLQLVVLLQAVFHSLSDIVNASAEECRSLGYTSSLLCSSCKELQQFHLERLIDSCERCCSKDEFDQSTAKIYPVAELEICG